MAASGWVGQKLHHLLRGQGGAYSARGGRFHKHFEGQPLSGQGLSQDDQELDREAAHVRMTKGNHPLPNHFGVCVFEFALKACQLLSHLPRDVHAEPYVLDGFLGSNGLWGGDRRSLLPGWR